MLDCLLQGHCAAAPSDSPWHMIPLTLPCREWTEDGQLWVQYVSSTPATRLDVITLQEKLDQQLQQRQVRVVGPLIVQKVACGHLRPRLGANHVVGLRTVAMRIAFCCTEKLTAATATALSSTRAARVAGGLCSSRVACSLMPG